MCLPSNPSDARRTRHNIQVIDKVYGRFVFAVCVFPGCGLMNSWDYGMIVRTMCSGKGSVPKEMFVISNDVLYLLHRTGCLCSLVLHEIPLAILTGHLIFQR